MLHALHKGHIWSQNGPTVSIVSMIISARLTAKNDQTDLL